MSDSVPLRQLQQAFGDPLFLAALELASAGAVSELRVLQSGVVVTGLVSGESPSTQRHRVYIRRAAPLSEQKIAEAECSCGKDGHCIHVAAVSIAAANNGRAQAAPQRTEPSLQRSSSASHGTQVQQRLCYLLQSVGDARNCELQLSLWVGQASPGADRIARGSASPFVPRAVGSNDYPRYVDASDRQILQTLIAQRTDGPWVLAGVDGTTVLNQVIATKRALWQSLENASLRAGKPRAAQLSWQLLPNGDQQLCCDVADARASFVSFGLEPPIYIDAASKEFGALTLPCSADLVRRHWHAPAVAPEQVATLNAEIGALPKLRTLSAQPQALQSLAARVELAAGPSATLQFVYNGLSVDSRSLPSSASAVRILADDVLHQIDQRHRCGAAAPIALRRRARR